MLRETHTARFSRFLWPLARKWSATNPEPTRGHASKIIFLNVPKYYLHRLSLHLTGVPTIPGKGLLVAWLIASLTALSAQIVSMVPWTYEMYRVVDKHTIKQTKSTQVLFGLIFVEIIIYSTNRRTQRDLTTVPVCATHTLVHRQRVLLGSSVPVSDH